jgi:hypothetical protein
MNNSQTMTVEQLIKRIRSKPQQVEFNEVMETISTYYHYTPTRFTNGVGSERVVNAAGTNEGSCKLFAFGQLNQLSQEETLACFGHYYREDVLGHPDNKDHINIRTFICSGWNGITFDGQVLRAK